MAIQMSGFWNDWRKLMHSKKQYVPIECTDGFRMSVQASEGNYSSPRDNEGPYSSVEVGYPSSFESLLIPYAEDSSNPTSTVYGWVPSAIVLEVIEHHGGWVSGEIPPMVINAEEVI